MATVEVTKHSDIEPRVACDGPLISTYIANVRCGKCQKSVSSDTVRRAADHIEDHQTMYGLALVKIDESEDK